MDRSDGQVEPMDQAALAERIQRMADVANMWLEDAEDLSKDYLRESNSAYLLRLLAFEIFLKSLVRINNRSPGRHHSYKRLFKSLPEAVKERVMSAAADRMSNSADYSNMDDLLDTFTENFTAMRYPYHAYESLSADGYDAAGKSWVEKGAPVSEAVFIYHPEELFGLTFALQSEVQSWLKEIARLGILGDPCLGPWW